MPNLPRKRSALITHKKMAFTASTMPRVMVALNQMFSGPTLTKSDQIAPAMTAKALLMNQTVRTVDRLEDNTCVGVKVWYTDTSAIGTVSAPTDCTTPGGNELGTLSVNYDTTALVHAAGTAKSSRCDNELGFIQESTEVLAKIISDLRKQFNALVIGTIDAASQTNLNDYLPEGWTENGVIIEVPKNQMTWDNLGYLKQTAALNNFTAPLMISGASNFWGEWWKSNYRQFNDNERGIFRAFQDAAFYFDERQLDQVVGSPATFIVDANSYAFWNNVRNTPIPTETVVGSTGRKWVWTFADPELSYSKDGRLTPVTYEIEVEESCVARDSQTHLVKSYKYYGRLIGGFEMAPPGPSGETGVLQFNAISGI